MEQVFVYSYRGFFKDVVFCLVLQIAPATTYTNAGEYQEPEGLIGDLPPKIRCLP